MTLSAVVTGAKELRIYIRYLERRVTKAVDFSAKDISREIVKTAQRLINTRSRWEKTGKLARAFRIIKEGKAKYRIVNDSPIAGYVERGTRPHTIRNNPLGHTWRGPDRGKSFAETGGVYMHRGSRAMRFMEDSVDIVANRMNKIIKKNVDQQIR